jgi:hypothetical protein
VAGPDQVLGHGPAHHAEADEPDRRHPTTSSHVGADFP